MHATYRVPVLRRFVLLIAAVLLVAGSVSSASIVSAQPIDTTSPELVGSTLRFEVPLNGASIVQDFESGLATIIVTQSENLETVVPPFIPGTTVMVEVLNTVINQTSPGRLTYVATDMAGNSITIRAVYDPVTVSYIFVRDVTVTTDQKMIPYHFSGSSFTIEGPVCTPDPFATFPVGTTVATCTLEGGPSVSATITVIDLAADAFGELAALVATTPISGSTSMASPIRRNMLTMVSIASSLYDAGQNQLSCLFLGRFELEVRSQVAKRRITSTHAALLYETSTEIRGLLGCDRVT